ncbi:hypothetical protein HMPREF3048_03450 [Corynebacterium sp. HMSC075D04]|uniref:5-methylcytosine restriction system specificity protein McrC n=1 Tax=Corynebacterium sp. HMSC075D04 TaxID=1739540 RepID=UPI0008A57311|nr:hypothetical protein [Corynebacterium sp. HMSC075D04]OFO32175.1 hypothetical protein HMPREF3048_03450 [Corynebacterium sp. HMSC075D04]
MTKTKVLLANVYIMMAYAFRSLERIHDTTQSTTEVDHLHDLLAEIVLVEATRQIKRGLDHGYRQETAELQTVRGRIDLQASIRQRSFVRSSLACRFDEFVADTPVNQAVRATVLLLARHGKVAQHRREALARLLPVFAEVTPVHPRSIVWKNLRLNRVNASYRWLLAACELTVKGLLPIEGSGKALLPWMNDETMSTLFERFVKEYFRVHHPQFGAKAAQIPWAVEEGHGRHQLPAMRTDITLSDGSSMLIIDTKYYGSSMQVSHYGRETIHSGNLYQIHTYVNNAAALGRDVSGLLLYARTDGPVQPDLDAVIGGHRIGATTLDLTKPWSLLREELDALLKRF